VVADPPPPSFSAEHVVTDPALSTSSKHLMTDPGAAAAEEWKQRVSSISISSKVS